MRNLPSSARRGLLCRNFALVLLFAAVYGEVAAHHSQRGPGQDWLLSPIKTDCHCISMLIAIWNADARLLAAKNCEARCARHQPCCTGDSKRDRKSTRLNSSHMS